MARNKVRVKGIEMLSAASLLCTCHQLAPGVGPRANQGDCKMVGAKLRIFPRGGGI